MKFNHKLLAQILLIAVLLLNNNLTNCLRDEDNTDRAGDLIEELLRESAQALNQLDENWSQTHPLIKEVLDSVYNEFLSLEQECKDKEAAISETKQSIENSEHYLEWIDEKLEDNRVKIENYEDQYCESSQLYINALKHQKIALSLIQFIKQALENTDSLSLVQKKTFVQKLEIFVQLYAQDKVQSLAQLKDDGYQVDTDTSVQQRTDEQVGTQHIDDNRERIDLENQQSSENRDWPQYKADLLSLCEEIEYRLQQKLDQSEEQQIEAGVSLSEYKIQVDVENAELRRHRQQEEERITRLEGKTLRQIVNHKTCMDELNIVFNTLIETRAEYNDKVEAHDSKRASLQEEYDLFVYVNNQYTSQVEGKPSYEDRALDDTLSDFQ